MQEQWKDINGWEDLYEISSLGNIRSKRTNKIRVLGTNNFGYQTIRLYDGCRIEKFLVHRLVAKAFIPNPENKEQVNHIDGDKTNNAVNNLEWCTQSENEIHAIKNGLKGIWNGYFKVEYNNGEIEIYDNQSLFARKIGVSKTTIRNWLQHLSSTYSKRNIKNIYFCDKSSTTSENK